MNQHEPIFFTPNQSTRFGQSRILHKGGGGDGGAADREAARQRRIEEGTQRVNEIFGIAGDRTAVTTPAPVAPAPIGDVKGGYVPPAAAAPQVEYIESPAALAAKQRAAMYDTTKNDTRQFFTSQLDEDRSKAMRELSFQKARQGIIGSSQANDLDSEFQKRYDRGLLDVANRADSAATQFRTADEQARLGLIAKVVAGLDQGSAAQNAMNTLQINQNAAKENYQSQRMGNVFSDMLGAYNQNQYNQGTRAGQQGGNPYGNFFTNDQSFAGTTSQS